MSRYYTLDGKTPRPATFEEYMAWRVENERAIVAHDYIGKTQDIFVSTVFLGLNHSYRDGPPRIFETMVFGGEHNEYQDRCSTWEQAEEMHARALAIAKGEAVPE